MREFPLPAGPVPSRFSVEIGGVTAVFVTRWNSESQAWYLDVYATDGSPVRLGFRLTVGRPIGWRTLDPRFPGRTGDRFGWLVLLDTSGAGEDPGLLDLGTRHRLLFIEPEDIERAPAVVRPRLSPAAYVPQDGPDSVFVPQIAAHWEALGIPAPSHQVRTDVATGDLSPLIGGVDMVAAGGGNHLYGQAIAGWDSPVVGKDASNVAYWELGTGLGVVAGEPYASLVVGSMNTVTSAIFFDQRQSSPVANTSFTSSDELLAVWDGQTGASALTGFNGLDTLHAYLTVASISGSDRLVSIFSDLGNTPTVTQANAPGYTLNPSTRRQTARAVRYGPTMAFWFGQAAVELIAAGLGGQALLERLGWVA